MELINGSTFDIGVWVNMIGNGAESVKLSPGESHFCSTVKEWQIYDCRNQQICISNLLGDRPMAERIVYVLKSCSQVDEIIKPMTQDQFDAWIIAYGPSSPGDRERYKVMLLKEMFRKTGNIYRCTRSADLAGQLPAYYNQIMGADAVVPRC